MSEESPNWFLSITFGTEDWFTVFFFVRERYAHQWSIRHPFKIFNVLDMDNG